MNKKIIVNDLYQAAVISVLAVGYSRQKDIKDDSANGYSRQKDIKDDSANRSKV